MLAQEWLYGPNRMPCKFDRLLERHLKLPLTFNPHSSVAVLNLLAERVVFTVDVPSMLYEMHGNKQLTYEGVVRSARLPYDCFWLEYSSTVGVSLEECNVERAEYGALIQRIGSEGVRMILVVGMEIPNKDSKFYATTITHIVDFEQWPPPIHVDPETGVNAFTFTHHYAYNEGRVKDEGYLVVDPSSTGGIINEVIFGIFLLTQPKIYSVEPIQWNESHREKRALARKPPLLEYRKIHVRIGKPAKRYTARPTNSRPNGIALTDTDDPDSLAAIRHRRYHKVMGHFRHYLKREPPHTVWIEPFYRGDPALGVTFVERDVTK